MGYMVSVITVCFNAEKDINKTMLSVLAQQYSDFEYIIKDGKSSDNTNQVITGYEILFQKKGIPMKHVISEDKGIYDAMNQAVMHSSGEWIIFMNAGDTFYDKYVLSDVFGKHCWDNVDVIYGHTFMKLSEKYATIINHDVSHLDREWSMNHQSIFERRLILEKYPFEKKYKIVSDYDHLLQIYRTYRFARCNIIISIMSRDGISNQQIVTRNKENALLYQKYNLEKKKKSIFLSFIKQKIRELFPNIEIFFYVKNSMKRTLCYIEDEKNNIR